MPKSPTDRRHFLIAGTLTLVAAVVMDFLLKWALPLPVQASLEAITIDQLIGWHLSIIAFLFSVIVVPMLYAVILFRRRAGDDTDGAHFEGNTSLEIAWTVLPLIVVVIFSFIGIDTLTRVTRAEANENVVQVRGFQWSWTFEYPEGFIAQELVLPVNERARMEMTATDVLHSFWVPEMRVKQDLVPGEITVLRFTPNLPGEYTLRCSEMCGLSHWSMLANVRVLERAEYDAWVAERTADLNPSSDDAQSITQNSENVDNHTDNAVAQGD